MGEAAAPAARATAGIPDGASPAVGGFGLSGAPDALSQALYERGPVGCRWSRTTAVRWTPAWRRCRPPAVSPG